MSLVVLGLYCRVLQANKGLVCVSLMLLAMLLTQVILVLLVLFQVLALLQVLLLVQPVLNRRAVSRLSPVTSYIVLFLII